MPIITKDRLAGHTMDVAERYGKPHVGAYYKSASVKSHTLADDYVPCACCGMPATNVHHDPPLRYGHEFPFWSDARRDWIYLKPALFALCGSGTTGCHDGFHGGARYTIKWVWDYEDAFDDWWGGKLLEILEPHSPGLYQFGHWEIQDKKTGMVIRHYGES